MNIIRLPFEVLALILERLDPTSLAHAECSCRVLRDAANFLPRRRTPTITPANTLDVLAWLNLDRIRKTVRDLRISRAFGPTHRPDTIGTVFARLPSLQLVTARFCNFHPNLLTHLPPTLRVLRIHRLYRPRQAPHPGGFYTDIYLGKFKRLEHLEITFAPQWAYVSIRNGLPDTLRSLIFRNTDFIFVHTPIPAEVVTLRARCTIHGNAPDPTFLPACTSLTLVSESERLPLDRLGLHRLASLRELAITTHDFPYISSLPPTLTSFTLEADMWQVPNMRSLVNLAKLHIHLTRLFLIDEGTTALPPHLTDLYTTSAGRRIDLTTFIASA